MSIQNNEVMEVCDLETIRAICLKVVEASPDAKFVVNSDGIIVVMNQQAELLFGYDRTELLGKPIEVLLPDRLRETHVHHRSGYFSEPRVREMGQGLSLKGVRRNGSEFTVQIKLAPIVVPKAGLHTLAVVRLVKDDPIK